MDGHLEGPDDTCVWPLCALSSSWGYSFSCPKPWRPKSALRSVWVEESGSQRAVNSFEDCVDNSLCVMRPFIPRSCPVLKGFQWSTESQRPSMDLRSKCVRTSGDEIHPSDPPDMRPLSNVENSARSATRRPQSCWAIEDVCPSVVRYVRVYG